MMNEDFKKMVRFESGNLQRRDEGGSESVVDWLGGHERSQALPFASHRSSHRHRLIL